MASTKKTISFLILYRVQYKQIKIDKNKINNRTYMFKSLKVNC